MTAARVQRADLLALRDSVEAVLRDQADGPVAFEAPGPDGAHKLWDTAVGLGWALLGLDEERGGSGGGLDELAVVQRALGRWVAPGPFIGTTAAALAVDASAADVSASQVLSNGVALGVQEPPSADRGGQRVRLLRSPEATTHAIVFRGDAVVLTGVAVDAAENLKGAFDWGFANPATGTPDGPVLVHLDPDQARVLGQRVRIVVAAQALGVSERTLELTVRYAKQRHQFGRPIGSFQAVKHRCAAMAIRQRSALAMVRYALDEAWSATPGAAVAADVACDAATAAAVSNAEDCLETHGAIGHTWEFAGHRYLKRAHALRGLSRVLPTTASEVMA